MTAFHSLTFDSPLGAMLATASDTGVRGLYFGGQKYCPPVVASRSPGEVHPVLARLQEEVREYFAGERTAFDLPLDLHGTPFQRQVWQALLAIPYGSRLSYGHLSVQIGAPRAVRAVGAAVGRNPVSILVPCHRVVGMDGSLTGYAGGLDRKQALLRLEQHRTAALAVPADRNQLRGLLVYP